MPNAVDPVDAAFLAEIESIEADIAARPDPRQQRLDHLRSVRNIYLQGAMKMAASASTEAADDALSFPFREDPLAGLARELSRVSTPSAPTSWRVGRQPSPERLRALAAAHEFLQGKTVPTRTSLILDHLESRGITVGGEVPVNNLSAMLSNDDRFQANGRSGWTLTKKEDAA